MMKASEQLRELQMREGASAVKASERLRELIVAGWEVEAVIVLRDALPLIADVVEAAETLATWWPNEVHGEISGEQFQPTRDALTALRDALE